MQLSLSNHGWMVPMGWLQIKEFGKNQPIHPLRTNQLTAASTGVLCVGFVFVNCQTHIFHASKIYHKLMYIHVGPFGSQKVSRLTFTSASLPVIMILRTTKIYLGVRGGSNIHKKIGGFFFFVKHCLMCGKITKMSGR